MLKQAQTETMSRTHVIEAKMLGFMVIYLSEEARALLPDL